MTKPGQTNATPNPGDPLCRRCLAARPDRGGVGQRRPRHLPGGPGRGWRPCRALPRATAGVRPAHERFARRCRRPAGGELPAAAIPFRRRRLSAAEAPAGAFADRRQWRCLRRADGPNTASPWRWRQRSGCSSSMKSSSPANSTSSCATRCWAGGGCRHSGLRRRSALPAGGCSGGIGMNVHAIKRSGQTEEPVDWIGTPDRLDELLAASDVLVLALPLTQTTERLLTAEKLALMKPDAILINLARGEIVDEGRALRPPPGPTSGFTACLDACVGGAGAPWAVRDGPPIPGPAQRHRLAAQLRLGRHLAGRRRAPGGGELRPARCGAKRPGT